MRKFSACRSSVDAKRIALIFVTPFDHVGHFGAEELLDALDGREGVFHDVVEQTGGDGHRVELHVGEEIGHREGVDQVGLAGMADLSPVLEGREDVSPPSSSTSASGL